MYKMHRTWWEPSFVGSKFWFYERNAVNLGSGRKNNAQTNRHLEDNEKRQIFLKWNWKKKIKLQLFVKHFKKKSHSRNHTEKNIKKHVGWYFFSDFFPLFILIRLVFHTDFNSEILLRSRANSLPLSVNICYPFSQF